MASAKKGKKNKGKTVTLSDFLQETPGSVGTMPIRKSTTNWADEVEDSHDAYDARSVKTSVVLPTAPKASRDFDEIIDKVPQEPPFIAYLTNLPYDVDENEISNFFRNMKISNMRIPKDDRSGEVPRLKGYGYVEFEDRESLLNALVIPDTTIKNRRIRIEVATDYDDKRRGGRNDMNRDRPNRTESSFGDWRSGPRETRDSRDNRDNRDSRDSRDSNEPERTWRGDNDRRPRFRDDHPRRFESEREPRGGFSRPPPREDEEPRQRPKLVLAPRSKPIESEASSAPAAIFGDAKPVDTASRERQIEERLAKGFEKERDVEKEPEKKEEQNGVVEKQKRNGEHEKIEKKEIKEVKAEEKPVVKQIEVKKKEEKKEKPDKEMPKLKKADPPNFVANNKFAYLQNEDSSD